MAISKEYALLKELQSFIRAIETGKHLQKNGKRIRSSSIRNYHFLKQYLEEFSIKYQVELRIRDTRKMTQSELERERKYWKSFYKDFTDYLYKDLNCYDNFVGSVIKLLKAFFNYLQNEKSILVGTFHKQFHVSHQQIQILILKPEQLHFMIYDQEFEAKLPDRLQRIKDILVVGSTVALRYSDLMKLQKHNLERVGGSTYLVVQSQKTQTTTRVLLPDYVLDIIQKYQRTGRLLPRIGTFNFNKYLKELAELAGWTEPVAKFRNKRGIPQAVYKNTNNRTHYRLCDLVSSHIMRRTAITNMLMLGVSELAVRKISGHSANSKEFFKYVELAQPYIDRQAEQYFERLKQVKTLENV